MNLRNLEYFTALAKAGSYGQAASALGISKSTLSHAIAKLEEEVGAKLVETSSNGCALTRNGHALVVPAKKLIESAHNLPQAMRNGTYGVVSIGVPRRCDTVPLLHLLQNFEESVIQTCKFNIVQETYVNLKEAVRLGRVDFGYCNKGVAADLGDDFDACPLADSSLYCMVGVRSSLAKREYLTPEDLVGYKIATLDGIQAQRLRQYCETSGIQLDLSSPPAMYRLSISLRVAMCECIAIDYQNWGSLFPDMIAIPLECSGKAGKELRTQATLFKLKSADSSDQEQNNGQSLFDVFWKYTTNEATKA